MNINIDEELNLFEKYNLTPSELFLIKIILVAQEETDKYLFRFLALPEKAKGNIIEQLQSLQDKGIILKTYKIPKKGDVFHPTEVEFNKNVVKNLYKSAYVMGEELYEAYPIETVVNGVSYKLRRISKKFDSPEDAWRAYGKSIKWNPETHEKILELIKQGKESGYIFTTLGDFIVDRDWNNLELLNNNSEGNIKLL